MLNRTLKQLKIEYPENDWTKDYAEQERILDNWVDLDEE